MPDPRIAGWLLGLATSPERASSTVGDLLEEAPVRGTLWFWSSVLRTAASLVWRGVADNPARMAKVAAGALAIDIALSLLVSAIFGVVLFVVAYSFGRSVDINPAWWTIGLEAVSLAITLSIGRMLARWAPGDELSACLAYAMLATFLSLIQDVVTPGGLGAVTLFGLFLGDLARRIPLLAGALWGRRRRLAAGSATPHS